MKNAFLLFIYKKPEQVNVLIEQILKGTSADIFVHINKKYDQIRNQLVKNERVYVTNNNLPANWGDDGLCKAMLLMFRELVQTGKQYNHVAICSGQDLLVQNGLDDFLAAHPSEVFLDMHKANRKWDRMIHLKRIPRIFLNAFESKYHPLRICRGLYFKFLCSKWGSLSEK